MWSSFQVWHRVNSSVASLGPRPARLLPQGEYLEKTKNIRLALSINRYCPYHFVDIWRGFLGILLMVVTFLASATVRPPNYSLNAIPDMSFTCKDKITCEARFRYGIRWIVRWPHWGRGQGSYCHKDNTWKNAKNNMLKGWQFMKSKLFQDFFGTLGWKFICKLSENILEYLKEIQENQ